MTTRPATEAKGQLCGNSHIARGKTCRIAQPTAGPAPLTPGALAQVPRRGSGDWRRKVAIAAGIGATGLALGLPAAGYFASGTASGRRASKAAEGLARATGRGFMSWASGPLAPVGVPLGAGLMAGSEGMRAGRLLRRTQESLATAPGFARGAAGLAARKARSAEARAAYLARLQSTWIAGQAPITPVEARRRAAEVLRTQQQITRLQRQAGVRSRAARRAARIARTGAAFRSSPSATEAWLRSALQSDPITRAPAALTAGLLRNLQASRRGLNARRPRFYRDAAVDGTGQPCGKSHIAKSKKCHLGSASGPSTAGSALTPAKVLGAAALAGGIAAGAYAWSKRDSVDLKAALEGRPVANSSNRKPNLVERLLAERRAKRCGRRGDALPLSATNECAVSTFAEVYLSKDGHSAFKVPNERDIPAARREFAIQTAAFEAGVPTAKPLAFNAGTGVIRMEYLQGRLGEEIFGESFDASRYPDVGLQLSAVMRSAHKAGIAHGDAHVGNWIQTRDGIKLIDWGMGSRKREAILFDLEDSPLTLGLGLGQGSQGFIRRHPAFDGYEDLVQRSISELQELKPRTAKWRQAVDDHYNALDAMYRLAQQAPDALTSRR